MLKDILAISGQSGLFKMVSKGNKSIIVESLVNGKRLPAHSSNKIISLEDIAVYTITEEVPLKDILKKISDKENGQPSSIDSKSSGNILKDYFKSIVPDFDEDRVYVSDIKKIIQWYNILQEKGMLNFEEESAEETKEETKTEE